MKKITLSVLFLLLGLVGFSQGLPLEGFEATGGPDLPSPTTPSEWTLGTSVPGNTWQVFDNGVGSQRRWDVINGTGNFYAGVNAAFVDRDNINQGNTSEDYLATPLITVPANGQLKFWTRTGSNFDQGTVYQVKVAPATAIQINPNAYTLLQQYSESTLHQTPPSTVIGNADVYIQKTVDLAAFAGQQIYIAFVRQFTQPSPGIGGDRWYIDDVQVVQQCFNPTALTATGITFNSAQLSWTSPGVTSWEIEVLPAAAAATGVGVLYSGALPYTATNLLPNTAYQYFVRSVCSPGNFSGWAGPFNFTTAVAPPVCGGNYIDSGGLTGNYANNADVTTTICPTNPTDVVTVTFTAFNTQATFDGLYIYNGNSTAAPQILSGNPAGTAPLTTPGAFWGTANIGSFTSSAANGCLTFRFLSNATTVATGWVSNVTCAPAPACPQPNSLITSVVTSNSVTLNWVEPAGATTWNVIALPCNAPAPNASTTGFTVANTNTNFVLNGLTGDTCYDIYVRSACSGGTFSNWSGPRTITTQITPPACGGVFVDTGGAATNYANNADVTTTICPTNPTDVVTVTFTAFNTQATFDGLYIYNGNSIAAPQILSGNPAGAAPLTVPGAFWGTTNIGSFTSTAANGCLTFRFLSNATTVAAGWVANVTCAPPPVCPQPNSLTTSAVTSNSVTLNWVETGTANQWNVIALPCNAPAPNASATGFAVANTNVNYVLTGLSGDTCYDIYVRSACSGGNFSTWSGPRAITTQVAPPACGGIFTDLGGATANYPNGADSTITICPTNPTDVVTVTFTAFQTETNWDALYVFNGNSIAATQIASANPPGNVPGGLAGGFWGTAIPGPFTSTAANGCLTFRFRSDGSVNQAGWVANVTCAPPPTCPSPNAVVATATTSVQTTLSWNSPNSATQWQVLALPCNAPAPTAASTGFVVATTNTNFILTGLMPDTCYNIYVRAVCGPNDLSTWSSQPPTVQTQQTPPACGGIFTDLGGATANYPNGADSTITICPTTPGDVVTVTFTAFQTETNWDALYVFDGNTIAAPQIASANPPGNVPGGLAGGFWGTVNPGPFTSSAANGCLTFRFRSDGSVNQAGWAANISCSPAPNCPKPTDLTATNITTTSALLGWTELNPAVTQWEVYVLPIAAAAPTPTDVGQIVSTNPALFTGLNPATQYKFYVRSICPAGGTSLLSNVFNFNTLIINDNCDGATFAPVNSSAVCNQTVAGTITGATASLPAPVAPCVGTADDDVWFQFIASNPFLTISLQNIVGSTTNLNFGVYSGQCGTLTQVFCSAANTTSGVPSGLIIGQTYYIRVYSNVATPQTVNFNLCISTPASCVSAQTACQNLNYTNTTGIPNQGTIGCLVTSPNPTYYTIQVSQTGPINLLLTQSTQPTVNNVPGPPNLDVDYAAWGPFTSQAAACVAIGNPITLAPGIGVPVTTTTGCSFSAASTENLNIVNAVAGQFYVILITNFSNQPGFISLTQTNAGAAGSGIYECCPDAFFSYTPISYCKTPGAANPVPVITTGSLAGTFSLHPSSPTGLVFANTATGEVNLAASAPGNYLILNTVAATLGCEQKQQTYSISIVLPLSATIAYNALSFCNSIATEQQVTQTGATGGAYAATPNGGLFINPTTGAINPSLSSPGIYTITYSIPGSSACVNGAPSATVEILPLPNLPTIAAVNACNSYNLPPLTIGNYYSQQGGLGTPINSNVPITTSQTIYVYATSAAGCTNERSFTVTINSVPTPAATATISSCAASTGTIVVTSPVSQTGLVPSNLFISEVTDAQTGSLTYIELFNGTGAAINLANYKLKIYNNGGASTSCDLALTGTIANNSTRVISVGSATNIGGVVPNQVFAICGGVNTNDNIRLTTAADVEVDLWGRTDGVNFTPSGQSGYTYRRLASATKPSLVWNAAEWSAIDPEDYSNVGSYTLSASSYQYSLDNGAFQNGTTFTNVTPGSHIVIAKDILTGCTSAPFTIQVAAVGSTPSVTNFSYPTPLCANLGTVLPDTSTLGFTTGGTFGEVISTGLVMNAATGAINVALSTPGTHTVSYSVPFNPTTCQGSGTSTFQIIITNAILPVVDFTLASPVCGLLTTTVAPTLATGFVTGGTFSSQAGLSINPATGLINITTSTPGNYTVTYNVPANPSQCTLSGTSLPIPLVITPTTTPNSTIDYPATVCKIATTNPTPAAGYTAGGLFTSTPGLAINANTGEINLANSTSGTYTITYTIAQVDATCSAASQSQDVITITPIVTPVTSFSYTTPICQTAQATLIPSLATGFNSGGTFSSTAGLSLDSSTGVISLATSAPGTYNVTYNVNGNIANCSVAGSATATIVITGVIAPVTGFSYTTPNCFNAVNQSPNTSFGFTGGGTFSSTSGLSINPSTGEVNIGLSTPGTYTVTYNLTANVGICLPAATNSSTIVINPALQINIEGGCQQADYIVTATPLNGTFDPMNVTYQWKNGLGVIVGTTQSITLDETGDYTVSVTSNGCTSTSAIFNVTSVGCQIQKGISPNNDGLNDAFDLTGFGVRTLAIYNRYGSKVYSKSNYTNQWIGQTDSGKELPDGTYYYVIEKNDGEAKSGWIYINREN